MGEYLLTPRATTTPFEPVVVALVAATTKTVLQVGVPSTTDIEFAGFTVAFDGTSGAGVPGWAQVIDGDVAATVTAMAPENWGSSLQPASLCVSGTSASGYNASVEGTMTSVRVLWQTQVHPQAGYDILLPEGIRARVAPSRFLRLRLKFAAAVNVVPQIIWTEPAV